MVINNYTVHVHAYNYLQKVEEPCVLLIVKLFLNVMFLCTCTTSGESTAPVSPASTDKVMYFTDKVPPYFHSPLHFVSIS